MRERARLVRMTATLLLLAGSACGHTHAAADTQPAAPASRAPERRADSHARRETSRSADGRSTPLASSAGGLLKPDGLEEIQKHLASRGYLKDEPGHSTTLNERTESALRAFQHDNGMPATGLPDDMVVRKLGLDPKAVFRAGEKQDGKKDD